MSLLELLTSSRTRKAQVSGVATGVAVILTAVLPDLNDGPAAVVTALLALLAAFGITYQTPNTSGEPRE